MLNLRPGRRSGRTSGDQAGSGRVRSDDGVGGPGSLSKRHATLVAGEATRNALALMPYCFITSALVGPIICLAGPDSTHRLYGLLLALCNAAVCILGLCYGLWRSRRRANARGASLADLRRDRAAVVAFSAACGLVWFWIPVLLFPGAGANGRLMIACTCAGMICTSLALVAVPLAQRALALPLIAGFFLALVLTGERQLVALGTLLVIYGLFVVGAAKQLERLFLRYRRLRYEFLDQTSTVQLLLGHPETGHGSLLWETGADGCLLNVNERLATALGVRRSQLEGLPLPTLLMASAEDDAHARLTACLADRVAFRNLAGPVGIAASPDRSVSGITAGSFPPTPGPEVPRTWSFTGRPVFEGGGEFAGFRGVATDITQTREAARRASHRTRHDSLTGLLNRYGFSDRLRLALHALGRNGTPFALLIVDLDDFSAVNEAYGYGTGDRILKTMAARLRSACDATAILARHGGDQFMILVEAADVDIVDDLSRRLLASLAEPVLVGDERVVCSASIGVCLAPLAGDTIDSLLEAADLALARARRDGGQSVCFYEPRLRLLVEEQRSLLADLRRAVARHAFGVEYQPIVDTQTLALRGFEALLRWHRPGYGPVPPDRFIRVAEEAGLICELGAWVLEQACREAVSWPSRVRVAVNVSVSQLESPGFARQVASILSKVGLEPSRLELEITESIFMDANASSFGVLESLRELGVGIALDDFGCGFSSLGFLRGFSFSKLKMDTTFVREMGIDRRAHAVVSAIVNLAAELGVAVTAEGVETPQQLSILRQMGCTQAQGFLFSRPMQPAAIPPLLDQIGGEMALSPAPDAVLGEPPETQPGARFSFGAGRGDGTDPAG